MILRMFKKTRLTYNCAHLRSTKETVTVEFGKKNVHEKLKSSSSIKSQMFYCHYRAVLVDTWWYWVRDDINRKKKRFLSGIARIWGGGLPMPEFFRSQWCLKKEDQVARIGVRVGWGVVLGDSGNARKKTFFFLLMSSLTQYHHVSTSTAL